jgi:hypothetical protein
MLTSRPIPPANTTDSVVEYTPEGYLEQGSKCLTAGTRQLAADGTSPAQAREMAATRPAGAARAPAASLSGWADGAVPERDGGQRAQLPDLRLAGDECPAQQHDEQERERDRAHRHRERIRSLCRFRRARVHMSGSRLPASDFWFLHMSFRRRLSWKGPRPRGRVERLWAGPRPRLTLVGRR